MRATARFALMISSPKTATYYLPCSTSAVRTLQPGTLLIDHAVRDWSQAELYRAAQMARGVKSEAVQPLYVVLDPKGSWAFARSHAAFRPRERGFRAPEGVRLNERNKNTSQITTR